MEESVYPCFFYNFRNSVFNGYLLLSNTEKSADNSGQKEHLEVSCPNPCSKQGQLWAQTHISGTLSRHKCSHWEHFQGWMLWQCTENCAHDRNLNVTDALTAPDSSWAVSLEPQPGRHLGKMCWREGDQSWSPRVLRVMWAVSITSHSAGSSQLMTRDVAVQKWEQLDLLLSLKFKSISMCSGCSVVSYLQFSKASSG